jgi:hypothetical protein
LLVGGHAVAFHGYPRFTGDTDFLVERSQENAARLETALRAFGFGSLGLGAKDFLDAETVVQLGRPPCRIDLLTSIDNVVFQEAWNRRETAQLDGLPVPVISREDLLANKRAVARPQDLADIARLSEQAT